MDSAKLSTDDISAVFSSASNGLNENAWIMQSALVQRAYFLGLYNGLKALVDLKEPDGLIYMMYINSLGVDSLLGTALARATPTRPFHRSSDQGMGS
jgi:hypothetical protein